jgi:pyrroline-5-carboxylate reductase
MARQTAQKDGKAASKKGARPAAAAKGAREGAAASRSRPKGPSWEIGFLGGGNMAEAMIRGLVASGVDPATIAVAEPLAPRRRYLRSTYKVGTFAEGTEVAAGSRTLVLAVKPQILPEVLASIAPVLGKRTLVLSIAAGVRLARIEKALGADARVVRCMPNTPCLVGRGAAVLCGGRNASKADVMRARRILAPVSAVFVTEREGELDPVTGLSGSGPAYVYRFAEALIRGGRKAGLNDELARRLAYQTLAGAAEMLIATGESPENLRKAVSSPGGTTVAGLAALDEGGFLDLVSGAVAAATRRSNELARS